MLRMVSYTTLLEIFSFDYGDFNAVTIDQICSENIGGFF